MISNIGQNPPLQQNSQNQQANTSALLINQRRENFRNNSRRNHIQEFINSKRKSQQSALQESEELQESQDVFDFYSCLNQFKQLPRFEDFCQLRIFYDQEQDSAIKLQYQNSIKEYITSLQYYDPTVMRYLIPFLLSQNQSEANQDFVRTLFNIINDQQCILIHDDCIILIYTILHKNPNLVHQMQDKQDDFQKLFNTHFEVCSSLTIIFIIRICKILKLNNIEYHIPEKEPNIKIFFIKCVDFGDPETIYDSLYLLDCLTPQQRSSILGDNKQVILETYKPSPNYNYMQSEDLFKTILYGAKYTEGQVQRFYLNVIFGILNVLNNLRLAIRFLQLLWPIIYNIEMDTEMHDFEQMELRIILKILFYATKIQLSDEYNRRIQEIMNLPITNVQTLLGTITRFYNRAIAFL